MQNIEFYAFMVVALAILVGPMVLAIRLSHRVCGSRIWPRAVALGFWLVFVLATLAPYMFLGPSWASGWFFLVMPFSVLLEFTGSFGFTVFALIATIISASFWSTLFYVVFALILRIQRAT
jgi:hypothetical protein